MLPSDEAASFEQRAVSTYISPPFLTQATIFEFLARGRFEPNLARVREGLRARRDAMLAALEAISPAGLTWNRPEGGYFLWLELAGLESAEAAERAAQHGVAVVSGEDFFPVGSGLGRQSARLAFSYEPPERIAEGIERMCSALMPVSSSA